MDSSTMIDKINIDTNRFSRFCDTMVGNGYAIAEYTPKIPCFINDSNTDIINFYKSIHDQALIAELDGFIENWNYISKFSSFSAEEIKMSYHDFETGIISSEDLNYMLRAILMMNMDSEEFNRLFDKSFVISIDMLIKTLIKQIGTALIGLKGKNQKIEDCDFTLFLEHTFKSAYYEHFKNLINLQRTELIDCLTLNAHLTLWFYLKELGKGQHLQYDQNGNIKNQYHNKADTKAIKQNLAKFKNPEFLTIVKSAKLSNNGLSDFLTAINPTPKDLLVANIESENLVLSTGKNHSSLQKQIDLIKPLLATSGSVVIKIDDKSTADGILHAAGNAFEVKAIEPYYYISNFSLV